MYSGAQVTMCTSKTRSMNDKAVSLPEKAAGSVNAVLHKPNFLRQRLVWLRAGRAQGRRAW